MGSLIDDLARVVEGENEYLTVSQFAEIFQLHKNTVYKRISQGKIGHFKLGEAAIRIPRTEAVRLAQKDYRSAVDG